MAGVDPRTLQTLGNWRSQAMVERYSHLSPDHRRSVVEKLVDSRRQSTTRERVGIAGSTEVPTTELDLNLTRLHDWASRVA